jgi:hypothetical protein
MIRISSVAVAAILLAACSKAAPVAEAPASTEPAPAPAEKTVPVPRESTEEMYGATCTWGEVTSFGMSIWSYTCPTVRLIADEALPGFQRETTAEDGSIMLSPVIQFYPKAADAPIGAVIDAVRAASPGSESCDIEAGVNGDFVLMPTGAAMDAYSKFLEGKADGPDMPCGPLGPSEAGGRTFRIPADRPDLVVMIDWGTEPPVFDPDTLAAAN